MKISHSILNKKLIVFIIIYLVNYSISPEKNSSFEFIYIDANTGQSSGGHTAVKFQDLIYHFQLYPDGIFHIVREPWFDFRFSYNIIENRSMELIQIYPKITSHEFWENGFRKLYLIQNKHLQNLQLYHEDLQFIQYFLGKNSNFLGVEGLGYFDYTMESSVLKNHFSSISKLWLQEEKIKTWNEVKNYSWEPTGFAYNHFSNVKYPFGYQSFSYKINSKILKLGILEAIEKNTPLKENGLVRFHHNESLTNEEIQKLSKFYNELIDNFPIILKESKDYEYFTVALYLNTIKLIEKIIHEKKWIFLDTLTEHRERIFWKKKEDIQKISNETQAYFEKVKELVFSKPLTLDSFLILQDSANRVIEIQSSLNGLRPIRNIHGRTLPRKRGLPKLFPKPNVSLELLKKFELEIIQEKDEYYNKLKLLYPYHLITQNCTSEIFFSFDKIHDYDSDKIKNDLGKHINPLKSFSFIPFYASYDIKKNYHKTKTNNILSYRKQKLNELKKNKNWITKLGIDLRESFVPTSHIYTKNTEDIQFIFFTDDTILLRPIYGLGNLIYGGLSTLVGVFILPFDNGNIAMKGLKGVFFSFPELFFFNINKGSFLNVAVSDLDDSFPNEYKNEDNTSP